MAKRSVSAIMNGLRESKSGSLAVNDYTADDSNFGGAFVRAPFGGHSPLAFLFLLLFVSIASKYSVSQSASMKQLA